MQTPSVGRMVHYVMPDGQVRPAIISRVWAGGGQCLPRDLVDPSKGSITSQQPPYPVQLAIFLDGANDSYNGDAPVIFGSSVVYHNPHDPENADNPVKPRSWHWPEFIPDMPESEK